MKKIILTIGVLGLLYSCSTNQNTNELIEQNKQLQQEVNYLENELEMLISLTSTVGDAGCLCDN